MKNYAVHTVTRDGRSAYTKTEYVKGLSAARKLVPVPINYIRNGKYFWAIYGKTEYFVKECKWTGFCSDSVRLFE